MTKITFMGAGSTIFAKNILGDSMLTPALRESHIALYDIDGARLKESKKVMDNLNRNINKGRAKVTAHLGVRNRKAALRKADFVVNAIQVGGYDPATITDFEVPKKYGLRQTIADTLGIGGIFRALRTIPVMVDFARDMESVCPEAIMLNYTNPMSMVTGAVQHATGIQAVGLCHSVQGCAQSLLWRLGLDKQVKDLRWKIAGINHMAWLLEVADGETDLYPRLKKVGAAAVKRIRKEGGANVMKRLEAKARKGQKWWDDPDGRIACDMIRLEMMRHFGHYVTESSEHNAEYAPYWIKAQYPELIEEFNIPLDEYPRRCVRQIAGWKEQAKKLVGNAKLTHKRGHEYGSYIMEAKVTGTPTRIHGNVLNNGLIPNLPAKACVEVPCLVDKNGVQGVYSGPLPEVCAAMNRTNINVHLCVWEAALEKRKEAIYHAAYMDPHTAAELPLDAIRSLCDDLIKAHGKLLPRYR